MGHERTTYHYQNEVGSDPRSSSSLVPMLLAGILLTTIGMIVVWALS